MKNLTKVVWGGWLAMVLVWGSGSAQAGLIGMDVEVIAGVVVGGTPIILDDQTVTVGAAVELPGFAGGTVAVDLGDDAITVMSLVDVLVPNFDFFGLVFDWDSTGLALAGLDGVASDILGFDPGRVLLSLPAPYELGVDFSGLPLMAGNYVQIDLTFVPEPAAWVLLALAFGGLGWALRKERRTAA